MGVGQWRRGRVIGRGAFATVSLAASVSSGEVFAVKSAEFSRSGPIQWEKRILSALDSPFVISYLGFGVDPPAPRSPPHYNLFMEYASGGSLSDAVKKEGGGLDERAIRAYARDILGGLAYLHSSGVVHCDVKPQNVLICSSGRAKIADLGCARVIADEEEGGSGRVLSRGTPMFMAPEVARAEEQGAAADVWALGCTILEVATGRPPWPQVSDPAAALHRIAFSADVPEIPSWISAEGRDFLGKCLRRDPRERWTAQQLLQHTFIATSKSDTSEDWVSPKSTLDQAFWESISDENDEVVEQETEDSLARMHSLLGGGGGPNWTWDENWVVVRNEDGECSFPAIDSIAADEHRSTNREASASSNSASSSDDEFIVGADRADVEHVPASSCSHRCLIYECININDTTFAEAEDEGTNEWSRRRRKVGSRLFNIQTVSASTYSLLSQTPTKRE